MNLNLIRVILAIAIFVNVIECLTASKVIFKFKPSTDLTPPPSVPGDNTSDVNVGNIFDAPNFCKKPGEKLDSRNRCRRVYRSQ